MKVMGLVFTNDASLGELTDKRTMASLPFGGRYRHVDFALSNLSHAGIRQVGIVSRFNYQSLMNHIGDGEEWGLELEEGGLEFLTPYAMSTSHSYRGKLESLSSAMDFLRFGSEDDLVVMIDSAVLCNLDLTQVIASHIKSGRDITAVTKSGVANGKKVLDLALKLDEKGEVCDMVVDYAAPEDYQASVDIFVLSKTFLIKQVQELMARNQFHMDRDLVLGGWQSGKVSINVFPFEGTVMYNETIQEYCENSLSLADKDVRSDIFNGCHPIYTKVRDRVPSYYGDDCEVRDCIVADGCFLEGNVEKSVLFRQITVGKDAQVKHCIIMNDAVIGEGAKVEYALLDKDVTIRPGATLIGTINNPVIVQRGDIV